VLNNEFFLFFVLAHLTGDYVLQTNKVAKLKAEGIKGVAIHTSLVGLVQLIFLSFFGIRGIAVALLGTGIHFLIDYMKLILGKRLQKIELLYYFIDQALHLLVILLLTLAFAPKESMVGSYIPYIKMFIGLILIVYTSTVTAKNVARNFYPEIKIRKFFENNERWVDALTGVSLYCSYLVHPVLFLFALVIGAIVYCRLQAVAYKYSLWVSMTKFFVLGLFAFLVTLFTSNVLK